MAKPVSNATREQAAADRTASADRLRNPGKPTLWKRVKLGARNVLLGISVVTGAGAINNLTGFEVPKPLPPIMGTAGNIDKAIVGTGGAVVKGIDDLTLHHSDQLVENASKYPDADLAFSGDVDIPASIVDQYSKFGGTLVPDGNQDPYRVPQPAVRQDTNPNGNGFTDVLVIPAIDRKGNPTWAKIQFDPESTAQRADEVCVSTPGTLVGIDASGNATMPTGTIRNAQDLGTGAIPDPGFGK
jgi:hypothetical protein